MAQQPSITHQNLAELHVLSLLPETDLFNQRLLKLRWRNDLFGDEVIAKSFNTMRLVLPALLLRRHPRQGLLHQRPCQGLGRHQPVLEQQLAKLNRFALTLAEGLLAK